MVVEVLAGMTCKPRRVAAQRLEIIVKPPEKPRDPRGTTLHQQDAEAGVFLEDTVEDQADKVRHDPLRRQRYVFEVRGRVAATGRRDDLPSETFAADVDRNGNPNFGRGF